MIEITETFISNLVLHRISSEQNKITLNTSEYGMDNSEEEDTIKRIFLKPFLASTITYEFKHEIELEFNALYKLSKSIYENNNFFYISKDILQHLKSVSRHPNIKDGDLFVMKYNDIKMNNIYYEGLGIYKVERKEDFIETIESEKREISLLFKKGIGSRRLDKACLILFTEVPYTIFIIDNGSIETEYWKNDFVKVGYKNDFINNTNHFLTLAKSFITEQFPNEFEVNKADQIAMLNDSVHYFKNHVEFEKKEFEEKIFKDAEVIKSFREFDKGYREDNKIELSDNFKISSQAVKKQERVFKSVLKLDKNFHIYIHGDRDLIEQGVEKDGRKYYKIYYQDEA
jgi:hypothetical protein